MKEKLTVGCSFSRAFSSGRISKTTKNVNVPFLLTAEIPVNYISKFGEPFAANCVY